MNTLDACRAYLAKLPPAVSGAGGHMATFRAACETVRFGLADGDALALLREWNTTHCQPPWTEKELAHKLADARRAAGGQVRPVREFKPAVRVVWKIERKSPPEVSPAAPSPPKAADSTRDLWTIRPGEPIPARFLEALATWPAFRQHPAWQAHPQLNKP